MDACVREINAGKSHAAIESGHDLVISSMDFVLHACHAYAAAMAGMRVSPELQHQLDGVQAESSRLFKQFWDGYVLKYVGPSCASSRDEKLSAVLSRLAAYSQGLGAEILDSQQWAEMHDRTVTVAIKSQWMGQSSSNRFWDGSRMDNATTAASSVSMLLGQILAASPETQQFLFKEIVVPMVSEMPQRNALLQIEIQGERKPTLLFMEKCLIAVFVESSLMPPEFREDVCMMFIKKKLSLRNSYEFRGYCTALRELLDTNPQV